MKKLILIGCTIIVIIIIILVIGISNLGPLLKNAVNHYGPQITKTDVFLGDVSVSLFSGEIKLKEFLLGNPKGFKSPQAMKVKSIFVNIDEKSLTEDAIIIDKIEVIGPEITYEKIKGTDNFKSILENVKGDTGGAPSSREKTDQGREGKKLIINDFVVRDGKISLAATMLEAKEISVPLSDIHLKEIGKKEGGTSAQKAFKEIFAALHSSIASPAVTNAINQGLKELGTSLKEVTGSATKQMDDLGEGAVKGVEGVTEKVKGLFNK